MLLKENENSGPAQSILNQRVAAAMHVAKSGSGANAFELLNDYNLQFEKKKIVKAYYDKLGQTMPASVATLATDAKRSIRHSRALASNIKKASQGQAKPQETDAHHIVGRLDYRATQARAYLFNWGIGINDADNGVFLPRYAATKISTMPNASNHQGLHTEDYYFNVTMQLQAVLGQPVLSARFVLRSIKGELIAGTFPF